MPNIYICCYHSERGRHLNAGAQGNFLDVEQAIADQVWPYDNGDDPSFYIASRHDTPLTWGVCRGNVRRSIQPRNVVAFLAFQQSDDGLICYYLSAVATVAEKISHQVAFGHPHFGNAPYLNRLIAQVNGGWVQAEQDRPMAARHGDWEQRIADESYVIFSRLHNETYVSPAPPLVAKAHPNEADPPRGFHEIWQHERYKLVFGDFEGPRDYLRTTTGYGNQHPHIRIEVTDEQLNQWRSDLIGFLQDQNSANPMWVGQYPTAHTFNSY